MKPSHLPQIVQPRSQVEVAQVERVDANRVFVRAASFGVQRAHLALPVPFTPKAGDRVLVLAGDDGTRYVVGVLRALREVADEVVCASDGTTASISHDENGQALQLHDPKGRLLFEYRPEEARSVVYAPSGDLMFEAPHGDLAFSAQGRVRVHSQQGTLLESEREVLLSSHTTSDTRSEVRVDAESIQMTTDQLRARGERADFRWEEVSVIGRRFRGAFDRARNQFRVLENQAERLVERTKESFRHTEGLAQTRAGRLKLVAEEALQALGKRTLLKAEEDVKIKGEKIYLA